MLLAVFNETSEEEDEEEKQESKAFLNVKDVSTLPPTLFGETLDEH